MNLTINIGRNVGKIPLSAERWADFRQCVDTLVGVVVDASPDGQIVQSGTVNGWWNGDYEESYTVTVADASLALREDVTYRLSAARIVWEQESIAATWYEVTLIER